MTRTSLRRTKASALGVARSVAPRLAQGLVLLLIPMLEACNEPDVIGGQPENLDNTGAVSGRICAPDGQGWLENAHVYSNLVNGAGELVGIRETWTDRDGYFLLNRLPPGEDLSFYVQKGTYQLELQASVQTGVLTTFPNPPCIDPLSVNAAVVTGQYDGFSSLLEQAGVTNYVTVDGVDSSELQPFFAQLEVLLGFDLICLNGGMLEGELLADPALAENLAEYVRSGGALFVTDWAYDWLEAAFPDAIDFLGDDLQPNAAQQGVAEQLPAARVVDQSLAMYLNSQSVSLRYDLAYWPLIQGASPQVVIHVSSDVRYYEDSQVRTMSSAPLLASFAAGYGTVVYSTFRGEANLTDDMTDILQYMLYRL